MKKTLLVLIAFFLLISACGQNRGEAPGQQKLSADSLLTLVQKQTFEYFWSGAEPTSGLARERIHVDGDYSNNDQNIVTIGGSGFGVMAILVGIERGFITRQQGCVYDSRLAGGAAIFCRRQ